MKTLDGKRIALLICDGTDREGLLQAREALILAGADTVLVSAQEAGIALSGAGGDGPIEADAGLAEAERYDALVVPGGAVAAAFLLGDEESLGFIDSFAHSGRPVAAMAEGVLPVVRGGDFAGFAVSAPDAQRARIDAAGSVPQRRAVTVERGLVTTALPGGSTDFNNAMVEEFARTLAATPSSLR